jgi:hypothetical protein
VPQDGAAGEASVAIDGSKFKAVNSRDSNFTKGKMERRLAQIEESVARYLSQLDTADRQTAAGEAPSEELAARTTRLKEKLTKLEEEVKRLKAIEKEMLAAPDQQISFTDPDSHSMATSGRGSGMVGYNVQAAVDTTNHLIVAHEVTNVGTDKSQLANMANQAKAALEAESLEAFADRGYFKGEEILACEEAGITVTLPKPQTSDAKSDGRFGKQDFRYVAEEDIYICPAGERLAHHFTNEENGLVLHRYWTNACRTCALKAQCTKGAQRRIRRWEHEYVVDAVQARLDKNPDAMRTRREIRGGRDAYPQAKRRSHARSERQFEQGNRETTGPRRRDGQSAFGLAVSNPRRPQPLGGCRQRRSYCLGECPKFALRRQLFGSAYASTSNVRPA